eukprot:scaffold137218_cov109-Phaeocystis_antarctica.AAC.1
MLPFLRLYGFRGLRTLHGKELKDLPQDSSMVKVPPWQRSARLRLLLACLAAPDGSRRPGREARPLGAQPLPYLGRAGPPRPPNEGDAAAVGRPHLALGGR